MSGLAEPAIGVVERVRVRFRAEWLLVALIAAAAVYLALVPLGFLLWRTFFEDGSFTFDGFREAYDTFGLGRDGVELTRVRDRVDRARRRARHGLAYLIVRTDVPWKPFLFAAALVPLAIPGVLYTIAWIFLASPQIGTLNAVLEPLSARRLQRLQPRPG